MNKPVSGITNLPLYVSEGSFKSLWQKYYIYRDKLVLNTILKKIIIPFDELEKTEVRPPNIKVALRFWFVGNKFRPAFKFDMADFYEHLAIYCKKGMLKVILVTPENVMTFKEHLDRTIASYKSNKKRQNHF